MNSLKKVLAGAAAASIMSIALSFQAMAARIAFSDPSAEAGSEVTVNMKITSTGNETINSSDVMLSYDPSALQFISGTGATGDAGSIRVAGEAQSSNSKELAFALKFKALKPGTATISVSTQEVRDKDGNVVTVGQEGSSKVTITGEAVASGGASLSGLEISPGTLYPAFSPDVESYTATVGGDVDSITVSAPAEEGASVAVSGNEGLQLGENEILCVVTAADGQTTKTYRIVVTKVEGEVTAPVADQVSLKTYERDITVVSAQEGMEIPQGFVQCSVTIDGQAVQGWIWGEDPNPEYCIFYAINEEGESGFYRYDLIEKTLQRYFQDPSGGEFEMKYNATAEEYNALFHDYEIRFWIIMGLIALSVILLIVIIVLVAGRGHRDDFMERKEPEDEWEPSRRNRNQRLSREEQYMRGLEEEEEEAEREEDMAFARRVQSEDGSRAYGVRTGSYQGQGGGRAASQPASGARGAVSQGTRRVSTGTQQGSAAGVRGTGQAARGTGAGRGTVPAGGTRTVPVSEVRGAAAGGRQTGRPSGGSQPRRNGQGGASGDDDFEVIDLE